MVSDHLNISHVPYLLDMLISHLILRRKVYHTLDELKNQSCHHLDIKGLSI